MKLSAHSFILVFTVFLFLFVQRASAATTPFRSANAVTTDGTIAYTNLENCSATDGQTCDRELAASFANIYFRDFGTYEDFGMSEGSIITKVRIKLTGKASRPIYVGLSLQIPAVSNCQYPSDIWTTYNWSGPEIGVKNFVTNVTYQGIVVQAVSGPCLGYSNFENGRVVFRVNYSSSQSWSANIDNFEVAFDYDPPVVPTATPMPTPTPISTPTPTPTPTPTVVPNLGKVPLILIPGMAGSELKTAEEIPWVEPDGHGFFFSHIYPADEKVWVNAVEAIKLGEDDYFDILKMNDTGELSLANLALTGNSITYDDAINFFISQGYILNEDFFLFPYDWRKDISLTGPLLDQKIDQIKEQTGSQRVDIIAHSMGGLVARNYVSDMEKAVKVRKLFTLGTPHLGSVNSLKTLRHGGCLTKVGYQNLPFCLGVTSSEVKDVVQNMISAYELAPTEKYFDFYSGEDIGHSYPINDVGDIDDNSITGALDYSQTKTLLSNLGHNTSLYSRAQIFHGIDSSFTDTNGVEIVNIAGSGLPTAGQLKESYTTNILGFRVSHKDILYINGDQTVPLLSASLIDYGKGLSLLGDAKVYYTKQEHGNLVASGSALLLVNNILNNNSSLPDGVATVPYSFNGTLVSAHSPVNIHIYDSLGNHTGPTGSGDFEENISGSFYDTLDDAKFIYLPNNGQYTVQANSTGEGSFDLNIRKFEENVNTTTTLYKNVPLTFDTQVTTSLDTFSDAPPVLSVDEDGDGIYETSINYTAILSGNEEYEEISTPTPTPTATSTSESTSNSSSTGTSSNSSDESNPIIANIFPLTSIKSDSPTQDRDGILPGIMEVAGAKTFEPAVSKESNNSNFLIAGIVLFGGIVIVVRSKKVNKLRFFLKNILSKLPNYKNNNKPK
ncbi:MAG: hypothetical protein Q8P26_05615 [Candidatus Levybacteria bacterium]|nr:hypothetical protein [Candidatus Levybacteria bacterium]